MPVYGFGGVSEHPVASLERHGPRGVDSTKNYVNPGHAHQGLDVAMGRLRSSQRPLITRRSSTDSWGARRALETGDWLFQASGHFSCAIGTIR